MRRAAACLIPWSRWSGIPMPENQTAKKIMTAGRRLLNSEGPDAVTMRTGNGRGKVRLYTRQELDGRTRARKQFDAIAEGIAAELRPDQLSTVRKHLIEAFASCAIVQLDLNARLLAGEPIDVSELSATISSMTRLASRIGVEKALVDVTPPTVSDYLAHVAKQNGEVAP